MLSFHYVTSSQQQPPANSYEGFRALPNPIYRRSTPEIVTDWNKDKYVRKFVRKGMGPAGPADIALAPIAFFLQNSPIMLIHLADEITDAPDRPIGSGRIQKPNFQMPTHTPAP